ncbi:MAG: hypothetical protein DSZ06_02060 [Sulfurospirillum sp.]|nr:MAG: hypothetical protein DSZ06_02060 [Sulfurospirillum sp.]
MKKFITALSLMASLSVASQADDFLDYVGLGVALQDVESPNFDNGTAVVLTGGKELYYGLGMEMEGTTSVSKMEGKFNGIKDEIDFWSLGMYSTYIWKLGNLNIKPRLGIVYRSLKSNIDINAPKVPVVGTVYQNTDVSGIGVSGGIGFSYNLGQGYNIYTNYTKIEDELDHLTFGAEYKF